jgi:hypothetical protein
MSKITKKLSAIEIGKTFEVDGIEFIKFPGGDEGQTISVSRDIIDRSTFGTNNNFAESKILKKLNSDFLPGIIAAVGAENVCEFETDLTTLDGLKTYGTMKSKVSLPTFDFYRTNVEIFDKYNPDMWWWLSTPDSAEPHYEDCSWISCVAPSGRICNYDCRNYGGVRPILIFVSDISVSCEE